MLHAGREWLLPCSLMRLVAEQGNCLLCNPELCLGVPVGAARRQPGPAHALIKEASPSAVHWNGGFLLGLVLPPLPSCCSSASHWLLAFLPQAEQKGVVPWPGRDGCTHFQQTLIGARRGGLLWRSAAEALACLAGRPERQSCIVAGKGWPWVQTLAALERPCGLLWGCGWNPCLTLEACRRRCCYRGLNYLTRLL